MKGKDNNETARVEISDQTLRTFADNDFGEILEYSKSVLSSEGKTDDYSLEEQEALQKVRDWIIPYFLKPDLFDAHTATAQQLKRILLLFDIGAALSANKTALVRLFEASILPNAERIVQSRKDTIRRIFGSRIFADISNGGVRSAPGSAKARREKYAIPVMSRKTHKITSLRPSSPSKVVAESSPKPEEPIDPDVQAQVEEFGDPNRRHDDEENSKFGPETEIGQSGDGALKPPARRSPRLASKQKGEFLRNSTNFKRDASPCKGPVAEARWSGMSMKEMAFVNSVLRKQEIAARKKYRLKFWATFVLFWGLTGAFLHWRFVLEGGMTYCQPAEQSSKGPLFYKDTLNPLVLVLPHCVRCPNYTVCDLDSSVRCTQDSVSHTAPVLANRSGALPLNASCLLLLRPNNLVTWLHLVGIPLHVSERLLPFPLNQRVCLPDYKRISNIQRLENFLKSSMQRWRSDADCPQFMLPKDRQKLGYNTRENFILPLTVAARQAALNFQITKSELPRFQELWTALMEQLPLYHSLKAANPANAQVRDGIWLVSDGGETYLCSNLPAKGSLVCPALRYFSEHILYILAGLSLLSVAYYYAAKLYTRGVKHHRRRLVVDYLVRLVKNTLIDTKQHYLRAKARGYPVNTTEKYSVIAHLLDLYLLPDNHSLHHFGGTPNSQRAQRKLTARKWYSPTTWLGLSFSPLSSYSNSRGSSSIRMPANRLLAQFDPRIRSYIHGFDKGELDKVYHQIQSQVSRDSNVRTSCFEIDGIQQEAWEWIGHLPPVTSLLNSAPSSAASSPHSSPLQR